MLLNIEKSGEQDYERSEEWLVNTDLDLSGLEVFADDKFDIIQMMPYAVGRI